MARARNIKPAFFTNELLGTEDPMVSLTFIGLWCLADKVGILEDRPLRIKAELFPYRDSLDINGYLTVLARLGFIVRYENDGRRFIQVCNFRKHQSPHNTEKGKGFPFSTDPKSLILTDNGYETVKPRCLYGESLVPERPDSLIPDTGFTDSLIPDSLIPDTGKKIKSVCSSQADEPEKTKAKRATKIPDPFLLTADMREWAATKAPDVSAREETENFVDYWRGAGKPKADWVATWRTWMRRAQGDTAKRKAFVQPVNRQQQIEDVNAAVVREIAERELGRAAGAPAPQQEDFLSTGEIIIEGEFTHAP